MEARKSIDAGHLLDFGNWTTLHKLVLALAALAIVFDGFDIQVLAFSIPALVKEWHVERSSFAPILAASLVAMSIGTALAGLLGDGFGRRNALIGSVAVFGAATLATAFVHGLFSLAVLRILAGGGLGGAVPNATAMSAEFTPLKRRSLAVSMTIVCIPLGGALAGAIASSLLQGPGWRYLFAIGGIAALALAALLLAVLPESPRFLVRRPARRRELAELLTRLGHATPEDATFADKAEEVKERGAMWQALWGGWQVRNTLGLWLSFVSCLFAVYLALNWLPTLLASKGFNLSDTSAGLAAYNFGGVGGALVCAGLINRFGSRLSMMVACSGAIASAMFLWASPGVPLAALGVHGLFANAVQTTLYALAAHLYPTRIRAGGVAAAVAVGRLGGVTSALLGAAFVTAGPREYFAVIAAALLVTMFGLALVTDHIPRFRQVSRL